MLIEIYASGIWRYYFDEILDCKINGEGEGGKDVCGVGEMEGWVCATELFPRLWSWRSIEYRESVFAGPINKSPSIGHCQSQQAFSGQGSTSIQE